MRGRGAPWVAIGAVWGTVLAAAGTSWGGAGPAARAQYPSEVVHQRHFEVDTPQGRQRALATFPRRQDGRDFPEDARLPLVVALHGRREALRGPQRGVLGWSVDYRLPDAFAALGRGQVRTQDYRGLVRAAHLRFVNEELRRRPFRGLVVVTPYTPDLIAERAGSERVTAFGDWLSGSFLDQVRAQHPFVAHGRAGTGIAGVSLGGMLALEAGLGHPDRWGAICAIQPAIAGRAVTLGERAARVPPPVRPRILLLSSERDPLLPPTRALSGELQRRGVEHALSELPGPHDYVFNRGPGALEMLRFFDAELQREPSR